MLAFISDTLMLDHCIFKMLYFEIYYYMYFRCISVFLSIKYLSIMGVTQRYEFCGSDVIAKNVFVDSGFHNAFVIWVWSKNMLGSCPVEDCLQFTQIRCWNLLGQRDLLGFIGETYFKDFFFISCDIIHGHVLFDTLKCKEFHIVDCFNVCIFDKFGNW